MEIQDLRIRYSWSYEEVDASDAVTNRVVIRRHPKNTRVTTRKDGIIYFGIARCNVPSDTMSKADGKEIALTRLDWALNATIDELTDVESTLRVHRSGLFGVVDISEVCKLLDYFDDIDDIMFERRGKRCLT